MISALGYCFETWMMSKRCRLMPSDKAWCWFSRLEVVQWLEKLGRWTHLWKKYSYTSVGGCDNVLGMLLMDSRILGGYETICWHQLMVSHLFTDHNQLPTSKFVGICKFKKKESHSERSSDASQIRRAFLQIDWSANCLVCELTSPWIDWPRVGLSMNSPVSFLG